MKQGCLDGPVSENEEAFMSAENHFAAQTNFAEARQHSGGGREPDHQTQSGRPERAGTGFQPLFGEALQYRASHSWRRRRYGRSDPRRFLDGLSKSQILPRQFPVLDLALPADSERRAGQDPPKQKEQRGRIRGILAQVSRRRTPLSSSSSRLVRHVR